MSTQRQHYCTGLISLLPQLKYCGETALSIGRVVETKCFGHWGPCRVIRTWMQHPVHNHNKNQYLWTGYSLLILGGGIWGWGHLSFKGTVKLLIWTVYTWSWLQSTLKAFSHHSVTTRHFLLWWVYNLA